MPESAQSGSGGQRTRQLAVRRPLIPSSSKKKFKNGELAEYVRKHVQTHVLESVGLGEPRSKLTEEIKRLAKKARFDGYDISDEEMGLAVRNLCNGSNSAAKPSSDVRHNGESQESLQPTSPVASHETRPVSGSDSKADEIFQTLVSFLQGFSENSQTALLYLEDLRKCCGNTAKVQELETQIAELQQFNSSLASQSERLQTEKSRLESELCTVREKYEALKRGISNLASG